MGNKKELVINKVKEALLEFDPVEFDDEDRLEHIANLIVEKLSETI